MEPAGRPSGRQQQTGISLKRINNITHAAVNGHRPAGKHTLAGERSIKKNDRAENEPD